MVRSGLVWKHLARPTCRLPGGAVPLHRDKVSRLGRVPRDLIIPLLFGGGVLLLLLAIYPMEILIALSLAYLALIPFGLRRYNALARQEEAKVAPPA